MNATIPRLTSVEVYGLLGEYDHRIDFPETWEFVIAYGPNGVGKTKLLEAVKALLSLEVAKLSSSPFRSLTLRFNEGTQLSATKALDGVPSGFDIDFFDEDVPQGRVSDLLLELRRDGHVISAAAVPVNRVGEQSFIDWLERSTPWRRIGPDLWEDLTDGELVELIELRSRYGRAQRVTGRADEVQDVPSEIKGFCETVPCHLIETQRLLTQAKRRPSEARTRATVAEYSQDLSRRLNAALAANSRIAQRLDQTFPRRILEGGGPANLQEGLIRRRYVEQNELRSRLSSIGLIEEEPELPLPTLALEEWQREVLWTYLNDTDEKLGSFKTILNKVALLEDIINKRFLRKRISVSVEEGLTIRTALGDRRLPPENLSSGEQHELILVYDLLFNVPDGALVLIDEPEISLHVAWQQRFLADLTRVAEPSSLRFMLATHSPQIINTFWDRTVALGSDWEES